MENASNALIMAGAILIALIILSIGVYLVSSYSQVGESYEQTQTITEITKFNSNFTIFEGRNDITPQEIVTLYNFVKNYNKNNGTNITISPTIGDSKEFIKNAPDDKYSCGTISDYDDTGRIYKITFTKK